MSTLTPPHGFFCPAKQERNTQEQGEFTREIIFEWLKNSRVEEIWNSDIRTYLPPPQMSKFYLLNHCYQFVTLLLCVWVSVCVFMCAHVCSCVCVFVCVYTFPSCINRVCVSVWVTVLPSTSVVSRNVPESSVWAEAWGRSLLLCLFILTCSMLLSSLLLFENEPRLEVEGWRRSHRYAQVEVVSQQGCSLSAQPKDYNRGSTSSNSRWSRSQSDLLKAIFPTPQISSANNWSRVSFPQRQDEFFFFFISSQKLAFHSQNLQQPIFKFKCKSGFKRTSRPFITSVSFSMAMVHACICAFQRENLFIVMIFVVSYII